MADTSRLGLPLLDPAQAQKHVKVNEAFLRLDALSQITLAGMGTTVPPVSPVDGEVYAIGAGASGAWASEDGKLAVFLNNGWDFVLPRPGWRAFDAGAGVAVTFDGIDWIEGAGALSLNGAGFVHRTVETDHSLQSGSTSVVTAAIPGDAIVYGVTARVISTLGGATSFDLGVLGSSNRYGSGFGVATGSWARGLTGSPLAYYAPTDLVVTAGGGAFDGSGVLRVAVHFAELTLPRA
ncbi:MAG: DUF2793 domain-containing protein [Silicimonas sp.]|nr:DUF2793 domain-containing protein [Silicimonas sp.]